MIAIKRMKMFGTDERLDALDSCCRRSHERIDGIENIKTDLIVELKLIRKEMERHKENFESHDAIEMEKYDSIKLAIVAINTEIHKFNRILWITIGVFAVMNFFGITDSIKAIVQSGLTKQHQVTHAIEGG